MSRRIDLNEPLSDADKAYLRMMGRLGDIQENERLVAEKQREERLRQAEAVKPPTISAPPASPAVTSVTPPAKPPAGTK